MTQNWSVTNYSKLFNWLKSTNYFLFSFKLTFNCWVTTNIVLFLYYLPIPDYILEIAIWSFYQQWNVIPLMYDDVWCFIPWICIHICSNSSRNQDLQDIPAKQPVTITTMDIIVVGFVFTNRTQRANANHLLRTKSLLTVWILNLQGLI